MPKPVSYKNFTITSGPFNPANYVNFLNTADDKLLPVGMETLAVGTGTPVAPSASKYNVSGILADTAYITLESGTARFSAMGDADTLLATNGVKLEVSMSGISFMPVKTIVSQLRFLAVGASTTVNIHYFKTGKGGHA